jgi:hypothetical protein
MKNTLRKLPERLVSFKFGRAGVDESSREAIWTMTHPDLRALR